MRQWARSFLMTVLAGVAIQPALAQSRLVKEEYRVYDAVIRHMYPDGKIAFDLGGDVKLLVIRDRTVGNDPSGKIEGSQRSQAKLRISSLSDELIAAYETKSAENVKVRRKFDIQLKYVIQSNVDFDGLLNDPQGRWQDPTKKWEAFHKIYPDSKGYVSFSRVGFDKKKARAFVYFEHWCRSLCGSGHYFVLSRTGGEWSVIGGTMMWIA